MRPVSDAFRAAVRESHRLVVKVEILDGAHNVIGTLTDDTQASLVSGGVTLDQNAASRGRYDITVVDDGARELVPTSASDLLAPYGHECRVSRGLYLPDGTIEAPSILIGRIDAANVDDSAAGLTVQISGMDRSARVIDAKFEEPYEVAAGTNIEDAIRNVVSDAIPGVICIFPGSTYVTPALRAEEEGDRWAFAQNIATASGLELYFNGDGHLVLAPLYDRPAVATIAEGEGGVLLSAARGWVREGTYNRVVATGENTSEAAPARGVWTDLDINSPTFYFGPFGRSPRFYRSSFIATDAQALDAATTLGVRQLGTTQTATFTTIVDASLEPSDTVRVTRARAGIDEDNVLDQISIPLGADGVMSGTTRARQVAA